MVYVARRTWYNVIMTATTTLTTKQLVSLLEKMSPGDSVQISHGVARIAHQGETRNLTSGLIVIPKIEHYAI